MGEQFEHKVTYECSGDCKVDKITVNGVPLVPPPSTTRRSGAGSTGFYAAEDNTIAVRVTEFSMPFVGLYQATFSLEGENITKNLLEIGYPYHADGGGLSAESDAGSETAPSSSSEGASA
nr:uncharacterized protein LOC110382863 [Helicoverpa armigera]